MSKNVYKIALIGNPNVGKSTVFNRLTGLRQHTGNWAGKTVESARGEYTYEGKRYIVTDLPGVYSLHAISADERVSCEHLLGQESDAVVIVVDATSLTRNLYLVLSVCECCPRALVCVNLLDEARKKRIRIDLQALSRELGVPVVGTAARGGAGIAQLQAAVAQVCAAERPACGGIGATVAPETTAADDAHTDALMHRAEEIAARVSAVDESFRHRFDRRLDAFLTSRLGSIPAMILLLALVFWITIRGANYPSALLSGFFADAELMLGSWMQALGAAPWLRGLLVEGMFRTLGWVVAVMLPPMAIFFPLFTLLEDSGYLPRVAFNLDHCFRRCGAHGKQALTMCMGFGCNACGVVGCRIIDSPRERLIAMLTNVFVPCNGRFPTLIALISMFFVTGGGRLGQIGSVLLLTGIIVLGVAATLLISKLLSRTVLRGLPSAFTLELPPYRCPQFGQVIVRSVLDRTLFVLARAMVVAAPAGLIIWLLANVTAGELTLLGHLTRLLEPLGRFLGMDGVILLAFLLGFPANEIVLPLALMGYLAGGSLVEASDLAGLRAVLVANGWTWLTALCTMLFSLLHFPCATTLLTIKKESGSLKWTLVAFLLPTLTGMLVCAVVAQLGRLLL